MLNLTELFPHRKSFTDVVSYSTDPYACVMNLQFDTLAADIECGDVVNASGTLVNTSDTDAHIVVSPFVKAGANASVNVLRAPNVGSWVSVKQDALNATDIDTAVSLLTAKGFRFEQFHTS
ncbi:hypothetical protein ABNJ21_002410 [Klebsiella michiganensis]|uniref:hypothetical protein n=1 Tax=Klebsiella michiganensis TaxID=1134687 RepID=UPI001CCB0932|nr:hypothetical protein [Klebsiella michiganensis]MBZ7267497.1 hypothetical protein [Klebsiella michiganensis]